MAKVFTFDAAHCNGCHNCQIACKDEHCDQAWLPYAAAQPLTGQFWCKLNETVRGQVPVVRVAYEVAICNHCANAPCIAAGGGAVYRRDDGLVVIDPAQAKGLKGLVESCPVGAIYYNETADLPQKCTGCAHLLDNGWDVPRCVDACPTECFRFVDESELDLSAYETLPELEGLGPKVYYLDRPKRFVAGCVVDMAAEEVVIGAKVELLDANGTVVSVTQSDEFGDFKFDQVEKSAYTVEVLGKRLAADVTERDLTLGDIDVSV
ncbi:MAG: (4Fe-4S)-binding protein [Coriobacteriales bacterium]|jgi:Fe-S-cluster-containing dehydrogenase component|nr:(4Fe-4S)-binding protein [Coriobacteriales bacterium]